MVGTSAVAVTAGMLLWDDGEKSMLAGWRHWERTTFTCGSEQGYGTRWGWACVRGSLLDNEICRGPQLSWWFGTEALLDVWGREER